MLELQHLTMNFGEQNALDDISYRFTNETGVYGLLGRNGEGKTTMMRILSNQITTYKGQVLLEGENIKTSEKQLARIGYWGADIYRDNALLTGRIKEVLQLNAKLYEHFDLDLAFNLIEQFGLHPKQKVKKLSTGNLTMFQNILGLASHSDITIFDEPTNGLDSINRERFFNALMTSYEEKPRMIILSTHLISEVENYLTDVLLIDHHRLFLSDRLENIQSKAYRIEKVKPENKRIIANHHLGTLQVYDLLDSLDEEEKAGILSQGGNISHLNLQEVFNDLVSQKEER